MTNDDLGKDRKERKMTSNSQGVDKNRNRIIILLKSVAGVTDGQPSGFRLK
ncbi:MAG: hypothetical protein Q4E34_00655 [Synergistaceae bacterium]|nr:hypothetical protein [Synergistaceae bacterium]